MSILKKIILLLMILSFSLVAKDIVVYENEYLVLPLDKKLKKLIVGNKDVINVSMLDAGLKSEKMLKIFGKKSGNTSILLVNRDGTLDNYHVYVNQNLGYIQKMVNVIEPNLFISKVGDGSTVVSGNFKDPHQKKRVYKLLENAGIDLTKVMDITQTDKINKMIRTKLYLVEINNNKAEDLGGVTGLGYFDDHFKIGINGAAENSATFSGWLLDNQGQFSTSGDSGLVATLNFLESKGIAKILDDTVLITTEDKNASFHVGGEVYIPIGMTQTNGGYPTIQLEEKEYGLRLTLTTSFLEKDDFMHMNISIVDSDFDPNKEHDVQLGVGGFGSDPIEVPSFISKHIDTDVVAKSDALIALGGRLHTEDVEYEEKIPFLGDIPILGALFTRTVNSKKQNDLLFFLVPEIVDANEDINDTKFYKEFKTKATELHKEIIDEKEDDNDSMKTEKTSSNVVDDIVIEDSSGVVVKDAKEDEVSEVIVIQEEVVDEPELKNDEYTSMINNNVQIGKKSTPEKEEIIAEEKVAVKEDKVVEESSNFLSEIIEKETALAEKDRVVEEQNTDLLAIVEDVTQEKEPESVKEDVSTSEKEASINIANIYIRSKPTDGKRVQVWAQDHKFTYDEEITQDGLTWVKIKQDCQNDNCVDVEEDLWVSKKYIR